jgi:hypothetical protein
VKPPKTYLSFSIPGAFIMLRDINRAPPFTVEIQNAFKNEASTVLLAYSRPEDIPDYDTVVIGISSHPHRPEPS